MKKYKVTLTVHCNCDLVVEGGNVQQAISKAMDMIEDVVPEFYGTTVSLFDVQEMELFDIQELKDEQK